MSKTHYPSTMDPMDPAHVEAMERESPGTVAPQFKCAHCGAAFHHHIGLADHLDRSAFCAQYDY